MEAMPAAILIAVVALAVGLIAWLRRRRVDREISSIDHYRRALSTLQEMQHEAPPRPLRVLHEGDAVSSFRADVAPPRLDPKAEGSRLVERAADDPVYVFDDSRPLDHGAPLAEDERRQNDWAVHHMGGSRHHRGRPKTPPLGVLVAAGVLIVLLAIGISIEVRQHGAAPSTGATTTTTAPHHKAPTTTVPVTQLAPVAQGPGTATYVTGSAGYTLAVTVASPCWVQATELATGKVTFAQVVNPGAAQPIALTGTATVSLGSPSGTSMSVNGTPITYPSAIALPFVLTFTPHQTVTTTTTTQPSSSTSTTSSAPTTTTTSNPF